MRVTVIGAGIAGLTLAAWLDRAGIGCDVYEAATRLDPVGAGIQLAPNAVRLLRRIGLGPGLDAVAERPAAVALRSWSDGRRLGGTELGTVGEERFGAPYLTVHRADLQRLLLDDVLARGVTVHTGQRCVGAAPDPDRPGAVLRLAGGDLLRSELVVGADGIRSAVRAALVHDEPRVRGVAVYRALVPVARLAGISWARTASAARVEVWLGPGRHCVWYPVSGGRALSVVAAVVEHRPGAESWRAPGDVAALRAGFAGWHPRVRAVLDAATEVTRWALHDRPPLDQWSRGRVTVVGDAAHPMLPLGAQGANQAVEDAASLATCLAHAESIEAALARYQERRRPRVAEVAALVARHLADHHLPDGPDQQARDRALADRAGLEPMAWLYDHDAEAAAR